MEEIPMTDPKTVILRVDGEDVPTLVYDDAAPGPRSAIVLSTEAFGINDFTRRVARELAAAGYVVVVPDYYHGKGLKNPESYTDFTEVMEFIEDLDFGQGAHDVMVAVDYARTIPSVDPAQVAVWGYCTGSTLALLTAALDRRLAAAVLFFPSQPRFPELTAKRPVHPIDMLWNVACPILLIVGDQDEMLMQLVPEFERRFGQWGINHQTRIYAGAGHAFSAPLPPLRHDAADKASWADALVFLAEHCPPSNR
jgi:carboxymethylenebutenolidase